MKKKHERKEVIQYLIQLKENELSKLEEVKNMYAESADLDEESSLSTDDFAQQSQSTESAMNLEHRLKVEQEKLNRFKALRPEESTDVVEGNVVVTNVFSFVIGLAIKDFEWNGEKYVGISTDAPIYQVMKTKKPGDSFEFNGKLYEIYEII